MWTNGQTRMSTEPIDHFFRLDFSCQPQRAVCCVGATPVISTHIALITSQIDIYKMSNLSSTSRTVFVRFVPPSANVRRHHLEDLFSQIGPIKKSSVIVPHTEKNKQGEEETTENMASSYGFIKYISEQDAIKAAEKLDRTMLRIAADEEIRLRVERASDVAGNKHKKIKTEAKSESGSHADASHKKTNRLIIRNLSFYAKASHIRQALQKFGPIEEIHLPTVSGGSDSKTKSFHRGFGFVTFVNAKDTQKCLQANNVEIYNRTVQIAKALHKAGYEKLKHHDEDEDKRPKHKKEETLQDQQEEVENDTSDSDEEEMSKDGDAQAGMDESDDNASDSDDDDDDDAISTASSESEKSDDDRDGDDAEKGNAAARNKEVNDTEAVAEKRSLFLRNLPFDVTRHDLFESFRKFGRISGIYIVKDKESGMPRGTAFVSFERQGAAQRALEASGSSSFASQRDVTEGKQNALKSESTALDNDGISIRGRHVFVNLAVDRDTASTLTLDKKSDQGKQTGKDRRNIYLKGEGRVDNDGENNNWDQLPEQDKLKRQKAWSEKTTKLKSPLFLISPTRLSIRNIAKDVDEKSLKRLCVKAVQQGLQKKLVTAEDQIAHWRAAGEMSTREILEKVDSFEHKDDIIPEFDEKNVRRFLPSVVIERDFSSSKKTGAPSRGFGFVEFLHHAHALASLRELNNNTAYTEDYVSGGRQAMIQKARKNKKKRKAGEEADVKVPRLIVEFAVENRAKAKKQAEHKAHQRANTIKQRLEHKEKSADSEKSGKKKKSRGKRQRELKRKQREAGITDEGKKSETSNAQSLPTESLAHGEDSVPDHKHHNTKPVKPSQKKRKVDKDEEKLSELVDSYEASITPSRGDGNDNSQPTRSRKRWFED